MIANFPLRTSVKTIFQLPLRFFPNFVTDDKNIVGQTQLIQKEQEFSKIVLIKAIIGLNQLGLYSISR